MATAWNSTAEAITSLRTFLHDGPKDRLVKQKMVVGAVDGVNKDYFTFEDRLIDGTLVVTVNFDVVTATVTDLIAGEFTCDTAPPIDATVRARYYFQFFLDEELTEAITDGCIQILQVDSVTKIPLEMRNAVLFYAGGMAYQKQAMRWAERMSHKFLLEEEPLQAEILARSNMFGSIADKLYKRGEWFRDDIYKSAGRRNVPAFGVYKPNVRAIGAVR